VSTGSADGPITLEKQPATEPAPPPETVAATTASVCSVRGLEVSYTVDHTPLRACRDVSFDLAARETLAIVGESGSGKSSALSAIGRLMGPGARISAGSIDLAGSGDIVNRSEKVLRQLRGQVVTYVPQQPMAAFNPTTTIGRQVAEPLRIHDGTKYAKALPRVRQVLTDVGLRDVDRVIDSYPHELSGGMLQRAMIAMAVIGKPKLLLADEPTSALDVTVQRQILALLRRIQHEYHLAVVIVSHDLEMVGRIADRVLVLYGGRVVEYGSRAEMLERPRHPYTRALLASTVARAVGHKTPLPALGGSPLSLAQVDAEPGCPFRYRCPRAVDACATSFPEYRTATTTFACHNPEETG
jgi:oligopeptide transport system ATP-binding protein